MNLFITKTITTKHVLFLFTCFPAVISATHTVIPTKSMAFSTVNVFSISKSSGLTFMKGRVQKLSTNSVYIAAQYVSQNEILLFIPSLLNFTK